MQIRRANHCALRPRPPTPLATGRYVSCLEFFAIWNRAGALNRLINGAEGSDLDKHLQQAKRPLGWNEDGSPQWGCGPI